MRLPATHEGPGLFDLQLNGYAGFDFNSSPGEWTLADFEHVRLALASRGVVAALPTLITADPIDLIARATKYAALLDRAPELIRTFPALHVEGPFIASEDGPRGAHPRRYCAVPTELPDLVERLRDASRDRIGLLTLAPELPGALELIANAVAAGIRVALAHTAATPDQIRRGVDAGAILSTHLGNGSHQVLPRLANYVQAQLAEDELFASFIADGHHVPWYTLKNFMRAKTPARSILVSDATAAADVGPGTYQLGGEDIIVSHDRRVHKPGQSNLAGSALTLDRAILNVTAHCDVSFADAWSMASIRPAALLGIPPFPPVTVRISDRGFSTSSEA